MVAGKGSGQESQRLASVVQGVARKFRVNIIGYSKIAVFVSVPLISV